MSLNGSASVRTNAGVWVRAVPRQATVIGLAALLLTFGALVPVPLARAAIVVPLALSTPGYAVVALAFGRTRRDAVVTVALSVLLSVAFYPLLCLLLYAAGITLSRSSVLSGTDLLLVLLAVAIALRDRSRGPVSTPAPVNGAVHWMAARHVLAYVGGLAFIVAALGGAQRLLPSAAPAPYTAFYLTGAARHAGSSITTASRRLTISIGIANHTGHRQTYRIVPALDGAARWHGHTVTLAAGHTWSGRVAGPAPRDRCAHRLSIALRSRSNATISDLDVWVRATKGAAACQAH